MPSTRSSTRAAQAAQSAPPRSLRPLAHRITDNASARCIAPAFNNTKKPRTMISGQALNENLNITSSDNVETRSTAAPAHTVTKISIKPRDANVSSTTTTTSNDDYVPFTVPAPILRQPFVASGCRTPGSRFIEHIDDDVPCWTEPIDIDDEEVEEVTGPTFTTSIMAYTTTGIKFLRNKTWATLHIFITTVAIVAMAIVSLRDIYGFLAASSFKTLVQDDVATCQTGLNIHDITAASWDLYIANFVLSTVNTQDEHLFDVDQDEDRYQGGDEHEDDDDFPDDITEDSCLWMPEEGSHFLQHDPTWDMMKLAAGIT